MALSGHGLEFIGQAPPRIGTANGQSDRLNAALSKYQSPVQIGQSAGATLVLYGACRLEKDQIQISARVLRVDTGDILELEEVSGPLESLFALQDSVIRRFLDVVDLSHTAIEWKMILRKPTHSVKAYAHWVRAPEYADWQCR